MDFTDVLKEPEDYDFTMPVDISENQTQDQKPEDNSSASRRLLNELAAEQHQPRKPNDFEKLVNGLEYTIHSPMAQALSARAAYLGLTGQVGTPGIGPVEKLLSKLDTPVAGQLLERMSQMKGSGWIMRPGLRLPNPLVAGGNAPFIRTLEYMPIPTIFSRRNPVQDAAIIVSHEVAHTDGLLHSKTLLSDKLPRYLPELKLIGERDLIKELRACLTEMHIADSLGVRDHFPAAAREDIGRFVQNRWMGDCPALAALTPQEASSIARNYMDKTFGPNLIDPVTKKVRAFDINAGVNKNIGQLSADKEAIELMSDAHYLENRAIGNPHTVAGEKFLAFAETRGGRVLINSGKTLGAIAMLSLAADLHNAFKESPSAGIARSAKVGSSWLAFEAGAATAMRNTQGMSLFARAGAGLLAGFAAAYLSDKIIGDPLERQIRSSLKLSW